MGKEPTHSTSRVQKEICQLPSQWHLCFTSIWVCSFCWAGLSLGKGFGAELIQLWYKAETEKISRRNLILALYFRALRPAAPVGEYPSVWAVKLDNIWCDCILHVWLNTWGQKPDEYICMTYNKCMYMHVGKHTLHTCWHACKQTKTYMSCWYKYACRNNW